MQFRLQSCHMLREHSQGLWGMLNAKAFHVTPAAWVCNVRCICRTFCIDSHNRFGTTACQHRYVPHQITFLCKPWECQGWQQLDDSLNADVQQAEMCVRTKVNFANTGIRIIHTNANSTPLVLQNIVNTHTHTHKNHARTFGQSSHNSETSTNA